MVSRLHSSMAHWMSAIPGVACIMVAPLHQRRQCTSSLHTHMIPHGDVALVELLSSGLDGPCTSSASAEQRPLRWFNASSSQNRVGVLFLRQAPGVLCRCSGEAWSSSRQAVRQGRRAPAAALAVHGHHAAGQARVPGGAGGWLGHSEALVDDAVAWGAAAHGHGPPLLSQVQPHTSPSACEFR